MAKLYFRYSAMNAGKTASLIMSAYGYMERDIPVLIFNSSLDTRFGENKVASRIGIELPAISIKSTSNILNAFTKYIKDKEKPQAIFVDEIQFFTKEQIHDLCTIVDDYGIQVYCYGIRTDYLGNLFPGSAEMLAIADTIEEIKTTCKCGKKATMNARITELGVQQVAVGDKQYVSLCRACFNKMKK